jgi:POT family proton-dependent oligopeptide transporter
VVANGAHIPDNITNPVESLVIYTHLFNILGFVGLACTGVALAILPLMKKLSTGHADAAASHVPLPAVRSEEFDTPPLH